MELSDVDLYVDSGLRGLKFYGLLGDIVDALPVPVDLIDRRMITRNRELQGEIRDTGVNIPLC